MKITDVTHLKGEIFRELEWFRPPGAEEHNSCGPAKGAHKITKELNLLNLGSETARKTMPNATSLSKLDTDPDKQFCLPVETVEFGSG